MNKIFVLVFISFFILNRYDSTNVSKKISTVKIQKNGKLKWTTTDEREKILYVAQQFKWYKWVTIETIEGKGTTGSYTYSVNVKFHSGINEFRIKQVEQNGKKEYSKTVTIHSEIMAVSMQTTENRIKFSAETNYELYDDNGRIIFKNFGSVIDITELEKGRYYINYDRIMKEFIK